MRNKNFKAFVTLNGHRTTVKIRADNQFDAKRMLEAQYGKIYVVQYDNEANRAEENAERARQELAEQTQRARREAARLEREAQGRPNRQPAEATHISENGTSVSEVVVGVFGALFGKINNKRLAKIFLRSVLGGMKKKGKVNFD